MMRAEIARRADGSDPGAGPGAIIGHWLRTLQREEGGEGRGPRGSTDSSGDARPET